MLKNKRGISEVIVTVLILLLIIAAISILWVVISGFLKSSSETISLGVNTINLEIVDNSLKYKSNGDLELRVKRNSGEGNLSGVKVLVEDESGQQVSYDYLQSIGELETRNILVPESTISSLGTISKVSIASVVISGSGKKSYGATNEEASPTKGFVSSNDLVLYMPFDGDAKDYSGNGNDGTCTSCPTATSGKIGGAYQFNGLTNKIDLPNTPTLSSAIGGTNQWSVAYWGNYKPSVYSSSFSKRDTGAAGISVLDSNGRIYINANSNINDTLKTFGGNLSNTGWNHIVISYNGVAFNIYINSVKKSTISPWTYGVGNPSANIAIGFSPGAPMNGSLDEVRIYNRVLTDKEIMYLYKYG
ncbi:LamG domain-containing protein [Candidatus Pacearchaeota archaeon]|nr:LamG domain-containing protein [Candidatus Pacearchaeota archaeon]